MLHTVVLLMDNGHMIGMLSFIVMLSVYHNVEKMILNYCFMYCLSISSLWWTVLDIIQKYFGARKQTLRSGNVIKNTIMHI